MFFCCCSRPVLGERVRRGGWRLLAVLQNPFVPSIVIWIWLGCDCPDRNLICWLALQPVVVTLLSPCQWMWAQGMCIFCLACLRVNLWPWNSVLSLSSLSRNAPSRVNLEATCWRWQSLSLVPEWLSRAEPSTYLKCCFRPYWIGPPSQILKVLQILLQISRKRPLILLSPLLDHHL